MALNPFLFLLLLTVVRYGTRWGYYALAISIAYYIFTPPYNPNFIISRLPEMVLFFILLIIFGAIQSRYTIRMKELEEKLLEAEKEYRELNERYEITSFLKENYEKKLLTQTTTMADLYGDARNMQVLDVEELYKEIHKILQKYVESEKSSLYMLEGNNLRLKSYFGYRDDEKPLENKSISESPYNIVFEKKELVSIKEAQFKETVISDLPVYIGPLKNSSDEIIGVLNVDNIRLLNFNRVKKKLFSLICDWLARAIENAVSYKISEGRRIITPETQIFKYKYFLMRLEEAMANSASTGAKFTFFLIEILDWDTIIADNKKSVLKFVSRIIQQNMRECDILAHFEKEYELALLMVHPTEEEIRFFMDSLQEQMDIFSLKPFKDKTRILKIKTRYTSDFYKGLEEMLKSVRS
ncbi:MAG: hypothetical protein BWY64_01780 [bacterium ADurb.Bin363]|nr:MAG: hypothetical protein BWY64_01780 [bacterium ADurb.Bin363]